MKSARVLRTLVNVALLLFMMLFLIQCGSGSGSGVSEERKPQIYKIDVSMVQTRDPAFAMPAGISADGKTVYGTIYISIPMVLPVSGFKWTREGGTVLINDVTGYKDYVTLVTHASDDGKVIIGVVNDIIGGTFVPWVWQESKGYKIINAPASAIRPKLHSVTPDGKMVLGSYLEEDEFGVTVKLFVWSEEKGMVAFDIGRDMRINVVGMADNGKTIIVNSYDDLDKNTKGPWILKVKDREDWFKYDSGDITVDIKYPSFELTDNQFYATDFGTIPFWLTAYSKDGTVIGGTVTRVFDDHDLLHPAAWLANQLRLVYFTGLGNNGVVSAVSPDGKWVAYASHFGVGDDYATLWNESFGRRDFYSMLISADKYYGTNLTGVITRQSMITGFSADNRVIVGSNYSLNTTLSLFGGFVIDNFDSVVKAP